MELLGVGVSGVRGSSRVGRVFYGGIVLWFGRCVRGGGGSAR